MALVNRSFSVNVTPGMMPPIVHVSEYDVGRAYTVSILDEQGNTFTIPSGTTASIEGTLNGSVGFTQSATISNNQVSFTLSQSMTAYSGKAWCKIKLTQNSQPIQTCAFVLAVDRAGVESGTIIGAPGFEEQISDAVEDYLDDHQPFFTLPEGGQSGQALLSDGSDGAFWGEVGIPEAVKTALLACFQNVAWANDQGQTYYDALADALGSDTPIPPTPSGVVLQDGSFTFSDGTTVEVSSNHVKITVGAANSKMINLSSLQSNTSDVTSANNVNNLPIDFVSMAAGSTWVLSVTNFDASARPTGNQVNVSVNVRGKNSSQNIFPNSLQLGGLRGTDVWNTEDSDSVTVSTATTAGCLFCFVGAAYTAGTVIDFDVSLVRQ